MPGTVLNPSVCLISSNHNYEMKLLLLLSCFTDGKTETSGGQATWVVRGDVQFSRLLCLMGSSGSLTWHCPFSSVNSVFCTPLNGTPLQYSCLENPMDRGAWRAEVHGVAEGQTRLSDFTFTFHLHALEKEMATHSSVLAWRIPGTGEPGGLPSMGTHRVGHDWSDLAAGLLLCES